MKLIYKDVKNKIKKWCEKNYEYILRIHEPEEIEEKNWHSQIRNRENSKIIAIFSKLQHKYDKYEKSRLRILQMARRIWKTYAKNRRKRNFN